MLQRIYGTVWSTQEELDRFLWRREEARKRDHRRLGVAARPLQLPRRQPGLGLLAPQGPAPVANAGDRDARAPGAPRLPGDRTPMLVSKKLWEQSGHWDHYADNMFRLLSRGAGLQPQAHELPGEHVHLPQPRPLVPRPAAALLRVRAAPPQRAFGRAPRADAGAPLRPGRRPHLRPARPARRRAAGAARRGRRVVLAGSAWRRASRSRTKPDKALGDPALWAQAEALIREALDASGVTYRVKPKDGTFYAPKIDIYIDDALGREWQMATIQVDLVMLPERFDLTYIDEHGQPQRPMAIHRAIYGSLRALHRHPHRALRRRLPVLVRAGAGGRRAHRRSRTTTRPASSARCSGTAASASRSTTPTTGCRTRSGSRRSRRCPYMLVLGDREIEARSGPCGPAPASSSRPSGGRPWPTGWRPRPPPGAVASRGEGGCVRGSAALSAPPGRHDPPATPSRPRLAIGKRPCYSPPGDRVGRALWRPSRRPPFIRTRISRGDTA